MMNFRNSVFVLWTLTVHLTSFCWTSDGGHPRVIGSLQPIIATEGDDIILPCHLNPPINVERQTVEWSKPDLKPDPSDRLSRVEIVHLYRNRRELTDMKIQSYCQRTQLFPEGLKQGNISLKITNVSLEDSGRYKCLIPKLKSDQKEAIVVLQVAPTLVPASATPAANMDVEGPRNHLLILVPIGLGLVLVLVLVLVMVVGLIFFETHESELKEQAASCLTLPCSEARQQLMLTETKDSTRLVPRWDLQIFRSSDQQQDFLMDLDQRHGIQHEDEA